MTARQWPVPLPPSPIGSGLVEISSITATPSEGFVAWLASSGTTIAISTGDRLLTIGVTAGRVVFDELRFDILMGLGAAPDGSLRAASRWQLHELHDALEGAGGVDRLLVNQVSHTTGFVGVRDLAVDRQGRVLFTTALCNGIATLGDRVNFDLVARPPYVTEDVSEERCHVLGLALDDGELAYLTAAAETDEPAGWQSRVADGGVVVDVRTDTVLARGLSLPCSPRLHAGRLYVANAGTGELVRVDRETGAVAPVVALPGMARGLDFVAGRAVVGCSVPPTEGPYLPAPVVVDAPDVPRHGIAVVDVESGVVEHTLTLAAGSGDVHSVVALPGASRVAVRWHHQDTDGWFVLKTPTT